MGFADALGAEVDPPVLKGPPCGVGLVLDQMGEDDATAFQAALDDLTIGPTALSRALAREGYRIGRVTIARHRNNECMCEWRRGVR